MPTLSPVPKRSPSSELLEHLESNKSSDYLNLSEPPAASETPDPSTLFPLKRRSSSNYQTALLGDQLKKVDFNRLNTTHGKSKLPIQVEKEPLNSGKTSSENYQLETPSPNESAMDDVDDEDPGSGQWSPEGSKRVLQRRSTGFGGEDSDNSFNVQYRGSVSYPPQSAHTDIAPGLEARSNVPRSYHSNQQSPDNEDKDSNDYFPRSFEYADFKRRMSKD